jgi:hypothetical protein
MAVPQSDQESLMNVVCGRLMAAPFVFFPDNWKVRPSKERQPADLAWACNNCIVLGWLNHLTSKDTVEKNRDRFKDGIKHNLTQARTSLRTWKGNPRGGHPPPMPITGKNPWHRFWLPRKVATRIVVLSIVEVGEGRLSFDPGDGFLQIHTDWAQEQGVRLCATVPQSFIGRLAGLGGSILDLLILLESVKALHGDEAITEPHALRLLAEYGNVCFQDCQKVIQQAMGPIALNERAIANSISIGVALDHTRHRPTRTRDALAPTVDTENVGAKYGILSDMYLGDLLKIAQLIAIGIEQVQNSDKLALFDLRLAHHDCGICVARTAASKPECMAAFNEWSAPRKTGQARPGVFLRYICELGCASGGSRH